MILNLKRKYKGDKYTIGTLTIEGLFQCDTIEDVDRGLENSMSKQEIETTKVYGHTAIPKGEYIIDMSTISPKFKERSWAKPYGGKLPRLLNVKGFEGVLIHVGNTEKDSLGCIIVGENKIKGRVINSTRTFVKLMALLMKASLKGEEIKLIIN